MKVQIKDQEITLKFTFRSMMMFENVTGNSLDPKTLTDIITYFYCVVLSSERNVDLSFEDFIDWVDDNPNCIKEFTQWLTTNVTNNNKLKKD